MYSTHTVAAPQPVVLVVAGDLAEEDSVVVVVVVVVVNIVQVVSLTVTPIAALQAQDEALLHQGVLTAGAGVGGDGDPGDAGVAQPSLAPVISIAQRTLLWTILVIRAPGQTLVLFTVEAVGVVSVTDNGVIFITVRVDRTDGCVPVIVTELGLRLAAFVLIRRTENLVVLQAVTTVNGSPDGVEDGEVLFAIQTLEVVSVDLPDKGALETVVVGVSGLDIRRVLVIVGHPVSPLVHVGREIAPVPVTVKSQKVPLIKLSENVVTVLTIHSINRNTIFI